MGSVDTKNLKDSSSIIYAGIKNSEGKIVPIPCVLNGKNLTGNDLYNLAYPKVTDKTKSRLTQHKQKQIAEKFKNGLSYSDLATKYKVAPKTIKNALDAQGINHKAITMQRKQESKTKAK